MNLYLNVYNRLLEFIKYRYDISFTNALDEKSIKKHLKNDGYIKFELKNNVIIILSYNDGKFKSLNPDTRKLIKDNIKKDTKELIYIIDLDASNDNDSVIKKMTEDIKKDYSNIWFQVRYLSTFYINIPNSKQIPKHYKLEDEKKIRTLLSDWHTDIKTIPRITEYDSPIVWLGLEPGTIVEIHRPSISTGCQILYRLVVTYV